MYQLWDCLIGQYSLVSIGQLFDADCDVLFQRKIMAVSYKITVIMKGRRTQSTGLWRLDLNHDDDHEKTSDLPYGNPYSKTCSVDK
jgi:hypothetical protein